MSDLVNITVVGRLTKDAEVREAGGTTVCKSRLAATPYKAEAMFFDVDLWGKRGEALSEYLVKGQQVVVVGDLTRREYQTNSGETRVSLDIRASDIVLVGKSPEREEGTSAPEASAPADDDEMDF